jgi:hypothetical protein
MSFMSEKKAQEVFKMQMQAELTGPDELSQAVQTARRSNAKTRQLTDRQLIGFTHPKKVQ